MMKKTYAKTKSIRFGGNDDPLKREGIFWPLQRVTDYLEREKQKQLEQKQEEKINEN